MASTTKVYYIIPDDGDDEAHPNMFTVPVPPQQMRLSDVRAHFPLKGHAYHFRFRKAFQNKYVWLDSVDNNQSIPVFEGIHFCKVSRIARADAVPARSSQPARVAETARAEAPAKVREEPAPKSTASAPSEDLFEWTDMDAPVSASAKSSTPVPLSASAPPPSRPTPSPPVESNDLLDFLGTSSSTAPAPSPPPLAGMDNFSWDANPFPAQPVPQQAANAFGGFVGFGPGSSQGPAKKPSGSKLPNEFNAETAKNFTL